MSYLTTITVAAQRRNFTYFQICIVKLNSVYHARVSVQAVLITP